jgi:hypothetical protein
MMGVVMMVEFSLRMFDGGAAALTRWVVLDSRIEPVLH